MTYTKEDKRLKNIEYVQKYYQKNGGRNKYIYVLDIPDLDINLQFKNKSDILKLIKKVEKSGIPRYINV